MPDNEPAISYTEARDFLLRTAREVVDAKMQPDGHVISLHVYHSEMQDLPPVAIRLRANGTWEYVDD